MSSSARCVSAVLVFVGMLTPSSLVGQTDVEERGRRHGVVPPQGYYETIGALPNAFQFSHDNGWIRRSRATAVARSRARSAMLQGGGSRAAQALRLEQSAVEAVTGDIRVPVFLALYQDTDSAGHVANVPRDSLDTRLYGRDPAPPYSITSYYSEVSNGLVSVTGTVFDWTRVAQPDSFYEGGCQGLCTSTARIDALIAELIALHDDSTDYGQFDNDGPDGVPNSGDDDGYIDAIVILHPEVGGECGTDNIWAHRWLYQAWPQADIGSDTTSDAVWGGGGKIRFRDYIIQGGQGGDTGCDADAPQAMGVVAHETGHLFALPDLYDTGGGGEGIGHWGIMGSGNFRVPTRPVHMMAWSKAQVGWVTEVLLSADTIVEISPVVTADTVYVLPVAGTDEYFLLENRQRIGSDSMMIEPGLLIWHVDSVLARARIPFNRVNGIAPYAVALEQADGRDDLLDGFNRGDHGDPFPGSKGNLTFGVCSEPGSWSRNSIASLVEVTDITQVVPFGAMSVNIGFVVPGPVLIAPPNPPMGVMGAAYAHQLAASGGVDCLYQWDLIGGVLPPGLSLAPDGMLSGRPEELGDFTATVEVTSVSESQVGEITISVMAPQLAVDSVVDHLLRTGTPLNDDELSFLDLQGNRNGRLDLADFVAWIESSPQTLSADDMSLLLQVERSLPRPQRRGR